MNEEESPQRRPISVDVGERPTESASKSTPNYFLFAALFIAIAGAGGSLFFLGDGSLPFGSPKTDRERILQISQTARNAVGQLTDEPCYRPAVIELLRAYKAAQMPRALIKEVKEFETNCAPLPSARFEVLRAYTSLSEFENALTVADQIVQEHPLSDQAWALRSQVKESLNDVHGAASDQRQALAVTPDPSRIHVNEWYRLAQLLQKLDRPCEAITPLQTYLSFAPTQRKTQQLDTLLRQLRAERNCVSGKAAVTMRFPPSATALIVTAEVNGTTGRFVVDTGASSVALSSAFAKKAGVRPMNDQRLAVSTANGVVTVAPAVADEVSLRGLTARSVFVGIHDGEIGEGIDGLLGLSFIGNFDFRLVGNSLTMSLPSN